jgi:hypothetical protein
LPSQKLQRRMQHGNGIHDATVFPIDSTAEPYSPSVKPVAQPKESARRVARHSSSDWTFLYVRTRAWWSDMSRQRKADLYVALAVTITYVVAVAVIFLRPISKSAPPDFFR